MASTLLLVASNMGPYIVDWTKDAVNKMPIIAKYATNVGKDAAVPFAYMYYHLRTYEIFDKDKFREVFYSNPRNKDVSEEKIVGIMDKLNRLSTALKESMLIKKDKSELTEKELESYNLIPRGEQGSIDYNRLIAHVKKSSADYAKLNIPIVQLMMVPGTTTVGEALGMPEDELEMNSSIGQFIDGIVSTAESAPGEKSPNQLRQLQSLKSVGQSINQGNARAVRTISAAAIQEYAAQAAANGDEEGLALANTLLSNSHIAEAPTNAQVIPVPPLERTTEVQFGDIDDEKVKDWIQATNPNISPDTKLTVPSYMVEPTIKGSAELCGCMPPVMVAAAIMLILVMIIIISLPRYLVIGILFSVAVWLVWESNVKIST